MTSSSANQASSFSPVLEAMQALTMDRVAGEVCSALEAASVSTILLKGSSVRQWLYPHGGRTYSDTDLLVAGSQFDRARAVLEGLGFDSGRDGWADFERPFHADSMVRVADGGRQWVDLHRNLTGVAAPDALVWRTLEANTVPLSVSGVTVRALNRSALAMHLVLHAVQHSGHAHTSEDLRRVVNCLPFEQWPEVVDLASRLGIDGALAIGLRLDPDGARLAERLCLPVPPLDSSTFWYASAPQGAWSLAMLWSAPSLREKVLWVRWTLVPSPARIRAGIYPVPPGQKMGLCIAYARWWRHVAMSGVSALRYVLAHRGAIERLATESGSGATRACRIGFAQEAVGPQDVW
jgi:hypothetical protein